jgi:adenylate cyclase
VKTRQIVISERVYSEIEELLTAESVGELTLKGFMKPVAAYNVLDVAGVEARSA